MPVSVAKTGQIKALDMTHIPGWCSFSHSHECRCRGSTCHACSCCAWRWSGTAAPRPCAADSWSRQPLTVVHWRRRSTT